MHALIVMFTSWSSWQCQDLMQAISSLLPNYKHRSCNNNSNNNNNNNNNDDFYSAVTWRKAITRALTYAKR